jgi:hypothetical protein
MKIITTKLFLFISFYFFLVASPYCQTGVCNSSSTGFTYNSIYYNLNNSYSAPVTVKLFINNVKSTTTFPPLDPSEIDYVTNFIYNAFSQYNIYFDIDCNIREIENNNLVHAVGTGSNYNLQSFCQWDTNVIFRNGIEIFMIPQSSAGQGQGQANSIPGHYVVIRDDPSNMELVANTIVHEIGHIFGLLHTYHGDGLNPCSGIPEQPEFYDCSTSTSIPDNNACAEYDSYGVDLLSCEIILLITPF